MDSVTLKCAEALFFKCDRCGKTKKVSEGAVDVLFKREVSKEGINNNFTCRHHVEGESDTFAVLCIDCLRDWLTDVGLEAELVEGAVRAYLPQYIEGLEVSVGKEDL